MRVLRMTLFKKLKLATKIRYRKNSSLVLSYVSKFNDEIRDKFYIFCV